ncbi:MAG TPA: hypothetical protein VMV17_01325 [Streptosporangiaceae bacterium]|nr:hypothetical protein [Streptosporangiaceae bacterium]
MITGGPAVAFLVGGTAAGLLQPSPTAQRSSPPGGPETTMDA